MLLLDLFVSQNKLTELEAKDIESDLSLHPDSVVDDILLSKKISNDEVMQVRSVLYGLPIYKDEIVITRELSEYINIAQSKQFLAIPISLTDGVLHVGIVDPDYGNALSSLQFLFGTTHQAYKLYLISYETFKKHFKVDSKTVHDEPKPQEKKVDKEKKESHSDILDLTDVIGDITADIGTLTVPEMFSIILRNSIDKGVSDIHIEHMGTTFRVRSRLDGQLQTIVNLPVPIHPMLVARIKILCAMKLDEKRKPQDGRFSSKIDDRTVDYRVSTFPGYYGEKVVIRILDSYRGVRPINELGFSDVQMKHIRNALARPYGIILISGPTGSGKTTTLYSMLNEIDREHRNVVSLEDPIEYNVPSMNQSQVFPEIGYTFASGLRSILRQDPDVIMVGEIRDAETAALAIQAALTGHLVFSTIHTNTAVGVITRLIDMGIESYLIAPTIIATIGQRLARKIADGCGTPMEMNEGLKGLLQEQFKDLPEEYKKALPLDKPFFETHPSDKFPTGMKGRLPVFEVLNFTNEIEDAILHNKGEEEIWKIARANGTLTMKEDGMIKCINGEIPFTEVGEL